MIAVDTNVLVHAHRKDASLHEPALDFVRTLAESRAPWAICFHSLIEFYAVVTRSGLWSVASSPEQAVKQVQAWRASPTLQILSDGPAVLDEFEDLVLGAAIQGGKAHEARMAATCIVHGVSELCSFDRDFSRFPGLRVRSVLGG